MQSRDSFKVTTLKTTNHFGRKLIEIRRLARKLHETVPIDHWFKEPDLQHPKVKVLSAWWHWSVRSISVINHCPSVDKSHVSIESKGWFNKSWPAHAPVNFRSKYLSPEIYWWVLILFSGSQGRESLRSMTIMLFCYDRPICFEFYHFSPSSSRESSFAFSSGKT
jgi:hypothetical protein